MTDKEQQALTILRAINESGVLFKHDMVLDAHVAGFLNAVDSEKGQAQGEPVQHTVTHALNMTATQQKSAESTQNAAMQQELNELREANLALAEESHRRAALLIEWLDTELDSQDEEYESWIASFTERVKAALPKEFAGRQEGTNAGHSAACSDHGGSATPASPANLEPVIIYGGRRATPTDTREMYGYMTHNAPELVTGTKLYALPPGSVVVPQKLLYDIISNANSGYPDWTTLDNRIRQVLAAVKGK